MTNDKDREDTKEIINAYFEPGMGDSLQKAINVFARIRSEAVQAERTRDIAGEVWDLLVEHLPAKDSTDIYDKMREKFPINGGVLPERKLIRYMLRNYSCDCSCHTCEEIRKQSADFVADGQEPTDDHA